jgi:hypothetical protein
MYSEAYNRVIKEKADKDAFDIAFDLLSRGTVLHIKRALEALGQKTLLEAFE